MNNLADPIRDARIFSLASEMMDELSNKMKRVPGMQPMDQIMVQMVALSRACAIACTTVPGGYETNARACADVLFQRIMGNRAAAESSTTRAYTLRPPTE